MDLGDIRNVFLFFSRYTAGCEVIPAFSNFKCHFSYDVYKSISALSIIKRSWQGIMGVLPLWLLVGDGLQCVCVPSIDGTGINSFDVL